jgi:hypothetical protein
MKGSPKSAVVAPLAAAADAAAAVIRADQVHWASTSAILVDSMDVNFAFACHRMAGPVLNT